MNTYILVLLFLSLMYNIICIKKIHAAFIILTYLCLIIIMYILILYTYTLYLYFILILYTYTLYLYFILILYTYTLYLYFILILILFMLKRPCLFFCVVFLKCPMVELNGHLLILSSWDKSRSVHSSIVYT